VPGRWRTSTIPAVLVQAPSGRTLVSAQLAIPSHQKTPVNNIASDLITHPGFIIRGDALVITRGERWHTFRVAGNEQHARSLVDHLGFDEQNVIFKPSGRWATHQYIYVRDPDDAVMVKLAL
jgi:hypothetical protein